MRRTAIALGLSLSALLVGANLYGLRTSHSGGEADAAAATSWNLNHVCTYCHDPHGGPYDDNLKASDIEVLCLTCHGPGGVNFLKAETHEGNTCTVCHDHHQHVDNWLGGENMETVGPKDPGTGLAKILTPEGNLRDVVFESRGTSVGQPALHSFADNDMDGNGVYDGVCEVCHVEEGVDNHNYGQTCTLCHTHATGFDEP